MTKTLTRLFDNYSDAENAVRSLEAMGVSHDDISIVANEANSGSAANGAGTGTGSVGDNGESVDDHGDVSRGTSTGALLGGAGGLLAGLGLLAIPGLGPIVAAGWLVTTVAGAGIGAAGGAATGGIVGALKNSGHTDEEANVYSEGVRRGSTLVSARVPDELASQAVDLFAQHNSVDAATRGADYRQGGWSAFDANAEPYAVHNDRTNLGGRM